MRPYYNRRLFDFKKAVGENLKEILTKKKISQKDLCWRTRIKEEDLDAILNGTFTEKEVFSQITDALMIDLELHSEDLLGNIVPNEIRHIREWENLEVADVAKKTGMTKNRLLKIEGGAKAKDSELRDIAYALHVGVYDILGGNPLPTQVNVQIIESAKTETFIGDSDEEEFFGFCGYVGILLEGETVYHWYPVSRLAKKALGRGLGGTNIIAILTMNNKVLLLNPEKVTNIMYTSIEDGPPYKLEYNANVPEYQLDGETPLVVYESLLKYIYMTTGNKGENPDFEVSTGFSEILNSYLDKDEAYWTENAVFHFATETRVYEIDFDWEETLSTCVALAVGWNLDPSTPYKFSDPERNHVVGSFAKVSMVELPLHRVIDNLCWDREEDYL